MTRDPAKLCQFVKDDGSQCQAYPQKGKGLCLAHDPEATNFGGDTRSRQTEKKASEVKSSMTSAERARRFLDDAISGKVKATPAQVSAARALLAEDDPAEDGVSNDLMRALFRLLTEDELHVIIARSPQTPRDVLDAFADWYSGKPNPEAEASIALSRRIDAEHREAIPNYYARLDGTAVPERETLAQERARLTGLMEAAVRMLLAYDVFPAAMNLLDNPEDAAHFERVRDRLDRTEGVPDAQAP